MAVPKELSKEGYGKCGEYSGRKVHQAIPLKLRQNLKTNLNGHKFFAYLETGFQAKHDTKLDGGGGQVDQQGSNVDYGDQTANAFYEARGLVACAVVKVFLEKQWAANGHNSAAFVRGAKTVLAVQGTLQDDGHHYDITCYYEANEIYVSFHCYPPRLTKEELRKNKKKKNK